MNIWDWVILAAVIGAAALGLIWKRKRKKNGCCGCCDGCPGCGSTDRKEEKR